MYNNVHINYGLLSVDFDFYESYLCDIHTYYIYYIITQHSA